MMAHPSMSDLVAYSTCGSVGGIFAILRSVRFGRLSKAANPTLDTPIPKAVFSSELADSKRLAVLTLRQLAPGLAKSFVLSGLRLDENEFSSFGLCARRSVNVTRCALRNCNLGANRI